MLLVLAVTGRLLCGCATASSASSADGSAGADGGASSSAALVARAEAVCPDREPVHASACGLPIEKPCTYTLAAVRSVHCHCIGPVWDCGTPLGIDSLDDAPGCPAQPPTSGQTCPLTAPPPYPGVRPGCRYQVPATPIIHDCFCAHFRWPRRDRWDCGRRAGDAPFDTRGCPVRQPLQSSLCTPGPRGPCQYGYNLSTDCQCTPGGQWRCHTSPQPPSPSQRR
jgi:hypothetical protein